jgi:hypothetical protein
MKINLLQVIISVDEPFDRIESLTRIDPAQFDMPD